MSEIRSLVASLANRGQPRTEAMVQAEWAAVARPTPEGTCCFTSGGTACEEPSGIRHVARPCSSTSVTASCSPKIGPTFVAEHLRYGSSWLCGGC
jgi:hypothetical protein